MTRSSDESNLPSLSLPHISRGDHANVMGAVPVAVHLPGYAAFEYIGRGAMGEVWRAMQLSTKRIVAIKVMHDSIASRRAMQRFEREIELTARLEHPNIARVFDSGVHQGLYYFAMELIDGVPLDYYVEHHKLSVQEQLSLMLKICRAMQHAHARGVIHRDLKPSNILVRTNGEPCVLDFGLSFALDVSQDVTRVSRDGEVLGTLAYMSPEQARGDNSRTDARTDVYSIGVMIYHMLLGVNPHDLSGGVAAVSRRIAEQQVRPPRQISRQIDRDLNRLVLKALELDPGDRYATVAALADDIARYLDGEPLQSQPATVIYFLSKRIRKYRGRISVVAMVVAVLLLVTILSIVRVVAERDRANAATILATNNAQIAMQNAAEARTRLARLYVARGMEHVDADDPAAGLPWLLEALRVEPDDRRLSDQHRIRLATVTRLMPDLVDMRFLPHSVNVLRRRDDGVLIGFGEGQVVEVGGSGQPTKPLGAGVLLLRDDGRMALTRVGERAFGLRPLDGTDRLVQLQGLTHVDLAVFAPDGNTLITTATAEVSRWDVSTGELQSTWTLAGVPYGLAFVANGEELATLIRRPPPNGANAAQIINARTGQANSTAITGDWIHSLIPLDGGHLALVRNLVVDGQMYTQVQVHDRTGQPLNDAITLRMVAQTISSHRGEIVFADDMGIHVLDLRTRNVRRIARVGDTASLRLQTDPMGDYVLGAWADGSVRLWEIASGRPLTPRIPHESEVTGWAIDGASGELTTCTASGVLRWWRYRQPPATTLEHPHRVIASALSADGRYLLAGSQVGAEIWRIRDGARVAGPLVTGVACTSGAFNADGSLLATSHSDGTVQVWRMPDAVALNTLRIGRDGFGARYLTFFPDGDRLLIHNHGRVSVWSTNTGAMLYELQVAKIEMVALSPDGNHIAVATRAADDGISIAVWDANTGGIRGEVRGPARLGMIAFTSDSRGLGVIDPTGEAWAYRVSDLIQMPIDNLNFAATSAQESRLYGPSPNPRWLAVDGATLAVSTVRGVKLTTFSGKAGATHILPAGIKPYVALHQQRGLVATVDGNGVVRAWSLNTAEPVTPQYAHGGRRGFIGLTTNADHLILSEGGTDSTIHSLTADGRPIADIARNNRMLLSHELINGSMIAPVDVDTLRTMWTQHAADRQPLIP